VPNLRRISSLAIVLLIGMRICIGWQFLYEGLWKLNKQHTARPWTSAGYLKNARGPFRNLYRNMAGDPDELDWLSYEKVVRQWDGWHNRFLAHYQNLTRQQKARLQGLLNGRKEFVATLGRLPEGVKFSGSLAKVVKYDPQRKRLVVDGKLHLTPDQRNAMLRMVTVGKISDPADVEKNRAATAYQQAVRDVYARSARLSSKEQARVLLKGDPDRATQVNEKHEGTIDHKWLGDIDRYQELLVRYEQNLSSARQAFQHEHLKKQWAEIQQLRVDLVGPVKALDAELKLKAQQLLTAQQLSRGPVSQSWTWIDWIDKTTIWSLIVLGVLLIAGLFTRLSAVGGACLLLSFYLAMPPWPGVTDFQELPGPEHSFLVDKNLIEVFALLSIVVMPTGQWFGVDAAVRWLVGFIRTGRKKPTPLPIKIQQDLQIRTKRKRPVQPSSG